MSAICCVCLFRKCYPATIYLNAGFRFLLSLPIFDHSLCVTRSTKFYIRNIGRCESIQIPMNKVLINDQNHKSQVNKISKVNAELETNDYGKLVEKSNHQMILKCIKMSIKIKNAEIWRVTITGLKKKKCYTV